MPVAQRFRAVLLCVNSAVVHDENDRHAGPGVIVGGDVVTAKDVTGKAAEKLLEAARSLAFSELPLPRLMSPESTRRGFSISRPAGRRSRSTTSR